jgi:plastocyanin
MARTLLASAVAVAALAVAVGVVALPATGQPATTLFATVGPESTITLTHADGTRVQRLDPGTYTLEVDDRSDFHNFRLSGPGVLVSTGVAFVGKRTFTITVRDGVYTYVCEPHSSSMRGTFRVGNPPPPPPPRQLVATVGPRATITVRTPAGRIVRTTPAGRYTITVRDRSRAHNFRLTGPGVNRKTGVAFVGTARWTVTLRKGATYRFRCEPHARRMAGSFRAT